MDRTDIIALVLSAVIGGLVSGGAITAVFYRALKDKLIGDMKPIFAKRSDLNGLGGKFDGMETVIVQIRDTVDENSDKILRLQESERHRWEPMVKVIEDIGKQLSKHSEAITRSTTILERLERRIDREEK